MDRSFRFFAPIAILIVAGLGFLGSRLFVASDAQALELFVGGDTTEKYAQIKIEQDIHDFGNIELNTFVDHTFFIKNTGTDTLTILNTHASCGCTAAVLDNMKVAPNGVTRLKVKYDAHNKGEGPMQKTITISSNSRTESEKVLRIKGVIVRSKTVHKKEEVSSMMSLKGIFQGDCAKCHVDKGRGELGARLYEADCAICHGPASEGKPAPDIASKEMMRHNKKSWDKITREGMEGTHMPAFHVKHEGPLNDEEIASIVEYLDAFKKELTRKQKAEGKSVDQTPVTPASKKAH
jgi:cytochrome c5